MSDTQHGVTVAGIDCGTNSIRLKIARVDGNGMHDIVPRTLRVIRLGQDVDKTHRFADEALDRAYAAAREFADILAGHQVDGLRFVATSATRDAANREEFEDGIERILGVRPEETMAIGDNINDIDMLKAAGLSIGVRNLNPAIRQYCDVVTDATNNEGAVAEAIEKYVL